MLEAGAVGPWVESHWPLTSAVSMGSLQGYSGASVIRLGSRQGQYVLKSVNLWESERTAAKHLAIFSFLADHCFSHAPRLVETRTGDLLVVDEGRFLYLMEYIQGKPFEPGPDAYRRLGEVAAALHSLNGYENPQLCGVDWLFQMAQEAAELLPSRADLDRILAGLPDFTALPTAIVHAELGQAIEDGSGRLVLVDWDEAGVGPTLIDAAGRLICDFVDYDGNIRAECAFAFYRAYFSARPPAQVEVDLLSPLAVLYALAYCRFADTEARFARVQSAIAAKNALGDIVQSSRDSAA